MKSNKNNAQIYYVLGLIALGAVSRLLPHLPNVTALLAVSALAGKYIENRWIAAGLPVIAMWISDLVLGFHSTMLFVYAAMVIISLISSIYLRQRFSWLRLGIFSLSGSVVFFVISNLGVWFMDHLYPMTLAGLTSCFTMAIPFFVNQMAGDFLYIFTTFGLMETLKSFQNQHRPMASE